MKKLTLGTAIAAIWATGAMAQETVPTDLTTVLNDLAPDLEDSIRLSASVRSQTEPVAPGAPRMLKDLVAGQDRAYVDQAGVGNTTDVDQSGNNNVAVTAQISGWWGSNTAEVNQVAASDAPNSAVITQHGSSQSQINQTGVNLRDGAINKADINQTGYNQAASISQNGDGNLARVDQSYSWYYNYDSNWSSIDQIGSGNKAQTVQSGGGYNVATTSQNGEDNESLISQRWYGDVAAHTQDGDRNRAYTSQNDTFWNAYNNSSIYQVGDDNAATTLQSGSYNVAAVEQQGYFNASTVTQTGSDWANVQQWGSYNASFVSQ